MSIGISSTGPDPGAMVRFLTRHFDHLNDRYHGPEGDQFAIDELTPIAAQFCPSGGRVLEVGCGYGRNLVALAQLDAGLIVGSDPSDRELRRAQSERVGPLPPSPPVALVRQEPFHLPFRDGSMDLVVLWQVVEHLFGKTAKPRVLAECVRVLRTGGHILIETPNQWFPFDYHDNKLPFVHWVLPSKAREWLTWKVRGMRYAPSEYVGLLGLERLLRGTPDARRVHKATRVYFADSYAQAWRELGGSQVGMKRALFVLAAPLHFVLSAFGGSADLVLPSLRVVYRIEK